MFHERTPQTLGLRAPCGVEYAPNNMRRCWPRDKCTGSDCPPCSNKRVIHKGDLVLSGHTDKFSFIPTAHDPAQDENPRRNVPSHMRWTHWGCVKNVLLGDVRAFLKIHWDGSAASSSTVNWSALEGYSCLDEDAKLRVRQRLLSRWRGCCLIQHSMEIGDCHWDTYMVDWLAAGSWMK